MNLGGRLLKLNHIVYMNKQKIIINSELDRQPGDSRDQFRSFLSRPVSNYGRTIKIGVQSAVVPNTAYTFHPNDTYLWYVLDVGGANTVKNVVIPSDRLFETSNDLALELDNLFTANGDSIDVTLDDDTMKLQFTNNTGSPIRLISDFVYEVVFNGTTLYNHANKKLGVIDDLRNTSVANGSTFTPSGLPRLSSTFAYHIISTTLVGQSKTSTPSPNNDPHILASVLNNRSFGDLLTVSYPENEIFYHSMTDNLSSIDIHVVDDEYRPVSLNGANVYLELLYSIHQ